jgi:glycosyltransferase involved in cell wall biosynthesis
VEQADKRKFNVANFFILVDRFGFPNGNASSIRIGLLGRALVEQGVSVKVLISKWSDYPDQVVNNKVVGKHKCVDFEYTYGKTVRDASFLLRRYHTFRGILTAPSYSYLYLYSVTPILCIPATIVAKLRRIPVIIELCEWMPSHPSCSLSVKWYYKHLRFTLADGVFAISTFLAERVRSITGDPHRPEIIQIPILADTKERYTLLNSSCYKGKYILWCGQIDGYIDSVFWLIKAFSLVSRKSDCKLLIVGRYTPKSKADIYSFANGVGVNKERIVLTGYVTREDLLALYSNAQALLAPLADDERSKARFPTKIGEYLASGRPVITSSVGEVGRFLKDGETAFIAPPCNAEVFAQKIELALFDSKLSRRIGLAGRHVAEQNFHYSKQGERIVKFFNRLSEKDRIKYQ